MEKEVSEVRPASITIASILFYIFGILGIIGSLAILGGGAVIYSVPYMGWLAGGVLVAIGIIGFILYLLYLLAGYWLWHSQRKGGIVGIIASVLDILTSIPMILIPAFAVLTGISVLLDIILIVLIAFGWSSLK